MQRQLPICNLNWLTELSSLGKKKLFHKLLCNYSSMFSEGAEKGEGKN